jgi:hypothetical protein
VQAYFNSTAAFPPQSTFNAYGRAYPDVYAAARSARGDDPDCVPPCVLCVCSAAVGHNLWVAQSGGFISVDGTSASAPIFAGVVRVHLLAQ